MAEDTYGQPSVWERLSSDFVLCYLDGDKEESAEKKYGVSEYPTHLVLNSDGSEMFNWRTSGYMSSAKFYRTFLEPVEKWKGRLTDWYVIGPFPNPDSKGLSVPYPPEDNVDLQSELDAKDGKKVRWVFAKSAGCAE